ncbi:hypothetical protein CN918_30585 [Priestia megaterium]|nr:hypothetical protein CN918_30585 [Priestia megaterium]
MKSQIITYLTNLKSKRFLTEELRIHLQKAHVYNQQNGYEVFYSFVTKLEQDGLLKPVKARGFNHMDPPLYVMYQYQPVKEEVTSELIHKLKGYHPLMQMGVFLKKPDEYRKLELRLEQLHNALYSVPTDEAPCTVNQRSFQWFRDEKYLSSKEGIAMLREVGITYRHLNCYVTYEPFMYTLSPSFQKDQEKISFLIVENKDTHDTLEQLFNEKQTYGNIPFDMVIYGEGKKILNSLSYLDKLISPLSKRNGYYVGDIDPEGLAIATRVCHKYDVSLAIFAYEAMLQKNNAGAYPLRKKEQKNVKPKDYEWALTHFTEKQQKELQQEVVLGNGYLPEEILTPADWRRL